MLKYFTRLRWFALMFLFTLRKFSFGPKIQLWNDDKQFLLEKENYNYPFHGPFANRLLKWTKNPLWISLLGPNSPKQEDLKVSKYNKLSAYKPNKI